MARMREIIITTVKEYDCKYVDMPYRCGGILEMAPFFVKVNVKLEDTKGKIPQTPRY